MAGLILTSHTERVAGGLALTCGRRDKYGDSDSRRKPILRSHLSRGLEQMHGLELEVMILLIGDPGLYWEFTEVSWNRTISVEASTTLRLVRSERSFGTSTCNSSLDRVVPLRGSISL